MLHVTTGVGELQSQQEDHLLRSFGVRGAALHILVPLDVQGQSHGQLLTRTLCWACNLLPDKIPVHNSASVLLKSLRQAVIDIFCSLDTKGQENLHLLLQTVSQLKHQVSWVSAP